MSKNISTERSSSLSGFMRGCLLGCSKSRTPDAKMRCPLSVGIQKNKSPRILFLKRLPKTPDPPGISNIPDGISPVLERSDKDWAMNVDLEYSLDNEHRRGRRRISSKNIVDSQLDNTEKRFQNCHDISDMKRSDIDKKTRRMVLPNLSDVRNSNFRIRLYHQLNVVKRRTSYLISEDTWTQSKRYDVNRRLGEIQRSKPIAIDMERPFDWNDEYNERKRPEYNTNGSLARSENEDVFEMDLEPMAKHKR